MPVHCSLMLDKFSLLGCTAPSAISQADTVHINASESVLVKPQMQGNAPTC